jgi:hypothetical protein
VKGLYPGATQHRLEAVRVYSLNADNSGYIDAVVIGQKETTNDPGNTPLEMKTDCNICLFCLAPFLPRLMSSANHLSASLLFGGTTGVLYSSIMWRLQCLFLLLDFGNMSILI